MNILSLWHYITMPAFIFILLPLNCPVSASDSNETYVLGKATRDGIGKFYMGREISKVMGHLGASWLYLACF